MPKRELQGWFSKAEQAQRTQRRNAAESSVALHSIAKSQAVETVVEEPSPSVWSNEFSEAVSPVGQEMTRGLIVDPIVEKLWPLPLPGFSVSAMSRWTQEDLNAHLSGDRLFDNLILNKYEFSTGATELKSFPWRLSVPFVLCNARCDFCSAWLVKGNPMPADLITQLIPVLQHIYELDLVGWGEPLIHPQFGEILENIRKEVDPRARIALTTNGTKLLEWADRLLEAHVSDFSISIHAATAETHNDVMGLELYHFDRILEGIKRLVELKKLPRYQKTRIGTVFIVMQQNIGEIPRFIDLCAELGVDNIFVRTLKPHDKLPRGLDYHRLPPYLHPEFSKLRNNAVAAIQQSKIPVSASPETWETPIFPQEIETTLKVLPTTSREERLRTIPKRIPTKYSEKLPVGELKDGQQVEVFPHLDNVYGRNAPMYCPSPYTAFYVNGFDRQVTPCCYIIQVPGYQKSYFKKSASFHQVWNSPAMIALRQSLFAGPLMAPCLKCPFYW